MRAKHDPTLKYLNNVVDFKEHSNSEIDRLVLPRTISGHREKLHLFDTFLELHPQASSHPDIQTCRAFMEWIGMGIVGRLNERPTVKMMLGIFRQFRSGLKRER
ncbi:Zinc finger C2H2 [Penicillium malachiteum]|uniref:Zinc finger C2H2 n=1 Tax=Penicillium malachiteum TaxID=1324776 RepID=A0AAD6HBN0_9EURO|nr:Zinc finger C2H2 [Penicillium malachiteum]